MAALLEMLELVMVLEAILVPVTAPLAIVATPEWSTVMSPEKLWFSQLPEVEL